MTLAKNAMTVNICLGLWTGHRLDKEATRDVTSRNGADADAARVNKHTIPKEILKPVQTAASALRAHMYRKTLPWKDNGDRLLPRGLFHEFMTEHASLNDAFLLAVRKFLDEDYPAARDQAEFRMGQLFNSADYPSADTLRHKFYVRLDIDAVTEAGDFRVELDNDAVTALQAEITRTTENRVTVAMQDVWERLAHNMRAFSKLVCGDAQFRNATLDNLLEIVDILPAMNIAGDPRLAQLGEDIKAALRGVEASDLRKDATVRNGVSVEVRTIMENMEGLMKAFGGDVS